MIAKNRKATFNYEISDKFEAGMVLTGTEVKSLRDGKVQLVDAFGQIDAGEAYVHQLYIAEYKNGNIYNHEPRRVRKLLLHRHQIERLDRQVREKGFTLVPLQVYWKNGRAKLEMGLGRGKKSYDKRKTLKERDNKREFARGFDE